MGRYNSDETPPEGVVHLTKGYSRDHRPDLNQVMLDLIVENQVGIPLLMKPMSGNSNDTREFGQIVSDCSERIVSFAHSLLPPTQGWRALEKIL